MDDDDDLLSILDVTTYVRIRVDHQLRYYRRRAGKMDTRANMAILVVYAVSLVGSILATARLETFVTITAAIGAAIVAWSEYEEFETLNRKYNVTSAGLMSIKLRAISPEPLPDDEFKLLVEEVKQLLESEATSWEITVRQAQAAFAERERSRVADLRDQSR